MLQELTAATGAQVWAITSMLFFLGTFIAVAASVWRTRSADAEACARLPLAADGVPGSGAGESRTHQGPTAPDTV